ncbi:MAG: hypothetical protein OXP09_19165 [Gammaproteobacteria bacterium]|nr:hypothetical protein [Gammaproteobacteria bacterium]
MGRINARKVLAGADIGSQGACANREINKINGVNTLSVNAVKVKSVDVDFEFSVDLSPSEGDSGNLEQDLLQLLVVLVGKAKFYAEIAETCAAGAEPVEGCAAMQCRCEKS